MKKRNLKSLSLNKKSISNLKSVQGGFGSNPSFGWACFLSYYLCDIEISGTENMVQSADYPCG